MAEKSKADKFFDNAEKSMNLVEKGIKVLIYAMEQIDNYKNNRGNNNSSNNQNQLSPNEVKE